MKWMGFSLALMFLLGLQGCASTSTSSEPQAKQVGTLDGAPVIRKTVSRATYFTGEYTLPVADIRVETKSMAEKVAIAAVKKAKLDIVGPLTLFLPDWKNQTADEATIGVGYPVVGSGQMVPQFQQGSKPSLDCLSVTRRAGGDNQGVWEQLYVIADQQGLQTNGDNRTVITPMAGGYQVELQLGLQ